MLRKHKNRIALFFAVGMFLFKIISIQAHLHASAHDDKESYNKTVHCDEDNHDNTEKTCDICVAIFEASITPFNYHQAPIVDCLTTLLTNKNVKTTELLFLYKGLFTSDLSTRPPPILS